MARRKQRASKRSALLDAEKAALGARVKAARLIKKMTVKELAKATGLYFNHIYQLERGRYAPSGATIGKLALALDVTADHLLGTKS